MNSFGINETKNIIALADHLANKMKEALDADGAIDRSDIIDAIIGEPSVVFKAIWGAWDIQAELEDLQEEEVKELLEQCLPIIKKMTELFI